MTSAFRMSCRTHHSVSQQHLYVVISGSYVIIPAGRSDYAVHRRTQPYARATDNAISAFKWRVKQVFVCHFHDFRLFRDNINSIT